MAGGGMVVVTADVVVVGRGVVTGTEVVVVRLLLYGLRVVPGGRRVM